MYTVVVAAMNRKVIAVDPILSNLGIIAMKKNACVCGGSSDQGGRRLKCKIKHVSEVRNLVDGVDFCRFLTKVHVSALYCIV